MAAEGDNMLRVATGAADESVEQVSPVSRPGSKSRRRRFMRTLGKRLGHLVVVLLLVTLLTSLLLELIPGDPATTILGETATPAQIDALNQRLGLDEPFLIRYVHWLGDAVTGDLGSSVRTNEAVTSALSRRVPVTFELAGLALLMSLFISIPLAVASALYEGGWFDRITTMVSSAMISSPSFMTALVLLYFFAVKWHVFPVTGWVPFTDDPIDNLRHAALPVASMALLEIAVFIRLLRSDMISTLREDFVLAARATGLPRWRVVIRHALRPSSFSLVTVAGVVLGRLIAGTVIVETIFAIPGLGQYVVSAIFNKDIVVVQAVVLVAASSYVVINLIVDLSYQWLDPRVRSEESGP